MCHSMRLLIAILVALFLGGKAHAEVPNDAAPPAGTYVNILGGIITVAPSFSFFSPGDQTALSDATLAALAGQFFINADPPPADNPSDPNPVADGTTMYSGEYYLFPGDGGALDMNQFIYVDKSGAAFYWNLYLMSSSVERCADATNAPTDLCPIYVGDFPTLSTEGF